MKVLVYLGYQNQDLDPDLINSGMGGTEVAALNLSEGLAKWGYETYLGGQVKSGSRNGVTWLTIEECKKHHFDFVIAASYLHYLKEFSNFDKSFFWFHNTDFHPWFRGEAVIGQEWLEDPRLTEVIALTNWHANSLKETYNISKPISVIGNSINRDTFPRWEVKKEPCSFIYSSARERGLYRLLELWPDLKKSMPEATLRVFGPSYDVDNSQLPKLNGVHYMGSVDQMTLHTWQMKSEYWLHPTAYEETYCITALEMQYAGCIPITTNLAALTEVVSDRGFLMNLDETNADFISIVKAIHGSPELKSKLRRKANEWAKQQSWKFRIEEWIKLLKKYEDR